MDAGNDLDINLLAGWWQWRQGPLGLAIRVLLFYPVPHLHSLSSTLDLACQTSAIHFVQ